MNGVAVAASMMSAGSNSNVSAYSQVDGSGGVVVGGAPASRKRPHDKSEFTHLARKILKLNKDELDRDIAQVFISQSDLLVFELMPPNVNKRKAALNQFLMNHSLRNPDDLVAAIQAEVTQQKEKIVIPRTPVPSTDKSLGLSGLGLPNQGSSQPEIKLAGAGGIPVAISTTLPPAVARLSQQQGGTPLDPCRTPDKGSPHSRAAALGSGGRLDPADQIAEKAKQEAYVLQRVAGLQREGLWFEKRLPKVAEPSRNKAHWDYLLEEMTWIATDFAQERKWKKAMARKIARSIQKHFQEKKQLQLKAERAAETHARRVASFMARGVKQFWNNVGKLVEFKQTTLMEEKRKQALDQHLSFIVGETEKFSSLVAESMNKPAPASTAPASTAPASASLSDGEFQPEGDWSDDEETIEREEKEVKPTDQQQEIEMLRKESELSLDDILDTLPPGYLEQRAKDIESEEGGGGSRLGQDSDFAASSGLSSDDEATLEEQEAAEAHDTGALDHEAEVKELEADNELSLEELKAKYSAAGAASRSGGLDTPPQDEADVEMESEEEEEDEDEEEEEEDENLTGSEDESSRDSEEGGGLLDVLETGTPLSSLLLGGGGGTGEKKQGEKEEEEEADQKMNDVAALAQSIQPKGYTLESTSVATPVPFLLQFPLREYQHVGLDWLVTMYDRGLNGILADEMGLGKTIQTISLLAHLACEKGIWGPHLIVVPTSVLLNWEMELKKWAPGFKVLTYYGNIKERRAKRQGWTKPNSFHVCVTSYKLAVQDHQSFRRKAWRYLILDEAQNIKNFKSQRWQLLLNFNTERRLLLTGTPLQNNLNELWSLMHFLMPALFQSHSEFQAWFSHPMKDMIEGNSDYNENIVKRLHKVLRPFLLRRLKAQVEKQLPKKYEHVVMCRLSNRQKYLYDDFMSRTKTKETLANGTMLSVINILMQLRKVCNHPNLFEERATLSPFHMSTLQYQIPSLVFNALNYDVFRHVNLESMNLNLLYNELTLSLGQGLSMRRLRPPASLIEEMGQTPPPGGEDTPPPLPRGKPKLRVRCKDPKASVRVVIVNTSATNNNNKVVKTQAINIGNILVRQIICQGGIQGLSAKAPAAAAASTPLALPPSSQQQQQQQVQGIPVQLVTRDGGRSTIKLLASGPRVLLQKSSSGGLASLIRLPLPLPTVISQASSMSPLQSMTSGGAPPTSSMQLLASKLSGAGGTSPSFVTQGSLGSMIRVTGPGGNLVSLAGRTPPPAVTPTTSHPNNALVAASPSSSQSDAAGATLRRRRTADAQSPSSSTSAAAAGTGESGRSVSPTSLFFKSSLEEKRRERRAAQLALVSRVNTHRLLTPHILYGAELRELVRVRPSLPEAPELVCPGYEARVQTLKDMFDNFLVHVPAATAPRPSLRISHPHPSSLQRLRRLDASLSAALRPKLRLLHPVTSAMSTQFPDPRLIQYDCGKLQSLDVILRRLKAGGHRVLIFTQMTRMLDVLEAFLNHHGHIYLRLDGTTKVEQRQVLMERFNMDPRIFCFILSTRSGGVGVNLTGADTVVFYDSDWNPTMDAQAQDRCHRIGQTRDVHIYRLISEKTIEENILKKANQKRLLGDLAIEGGQFTTAFFKSSTIHDLFSTEPTTPAPAPEEDAPAPAQVVDKASLLSLESALAAAEDATDVAAARIARAEAVADLAEFDETIPVTSLLGGGDQGGGESKAEAEVGALMEQLSGVERWAVGFFESKIASSSAAEASAAAAVAEMAAHKRDWELERLAAARRDEASRAARRREARSELFTYSSEDAANQVKRGGGEGAGRVNGRGERRRLRDARVRKKEAPGAKKKRGEASRLSRRLRRQGSPPPVGVNGEGNGSVSGEEVSLSERLSVNGGEKACVERMKSRRKRLAQRLARRAGNGVEAKQASPPVRKYRMRKRKRRKTEGSVDVEEVSAGSSEGEVEREMDEKEEARSRGVRCVIEKESIREARVREVKEERRERKPTLVLENGKEKTGVEEQEGVRSRRVLRHGVGNSGRVEESEGSSVEVIDLGEDDVSSDEESVCPPRPTRLTPAR